MLVSPTIKETLSARQVGEVFGIQLDQRLNFNAHMAKLLNKASSIQAQLPIYCHLIVKIVYLLILHALFTYMAPELWSLLSTTASWSNCNNPVTSATSKWKKKIDYILFTLWCNLLVPPNSFSSHLQQKLLISLFSKAVNLHTCTSDFNEQTQLPHLRVTTYWTLLGPSPINYTSIINFCNYSYLIKMKGFPLLWSTLFLWHYDIETTKTVTTTKCLPPAAIEVESCITSSQTNTNTTDAIYHYLMRSCAAGNLQNSIWYTEVNLIILWSKVNISKHCWALLM